MWKKVWGWGLAAVLAAGLSACGSSNKGDAGSSASASTASSASEQAPSSPDGKKVIKYWTDDRHDQEYIQGLVDEFNSSNKDNIQVEMTVLSENYNQSVDIAFSSNQAPDVLRLKSANTGTFYKKGYLEPLDAYLTDDMKAKFAGQIFDYINRFDGKTYSLPNSGLTLRLVYNKDLFAKAGIQNPPASLQEMVEDARKITAAGKSEGAYGFALNLKNPKSAFDRSVREILALSGYQGLGYDFKTARFDFAPYSQVMKYFKQMHDDGSFLPGSESLDIDPLRAQFAAGKIGMYLSFSTEPAIYAPNGSFPTTINWGAALAPTIDGAVKGKSEIVSAGTWIGISAKSANKEAAWKFLAFMYRDEVLKTYHEKGFGLAVVPSIAVSANKPEVPNIDGFLVTDKDALWPVSPTVTPEGVNYADAFFKYVLAGGDLDAITKDINARYNAALAKAVEKGDWKAEPNSAFDPMNPSK